MIAVKWSHVQVKVSIPKWRNWLEIFVIISGLPNDNLPKETCIGNNGSKAIEADAWACF